MAADFLLGYDPRIDTAPDFSMQAPADNFDVKANVPPVAAGPGNAHPSHNHGGGVSYAGDSENPTYPGSIYPTGE